MSDTVFLPGVPVDHILDRFEKAGGNEIASGKLSSPASSAALAVNAFGWFIDKPEKLTGLPGMKDFHRPARQVEVEVQVRFPWSGGRHPWLDAAVWTRDHFIGVESKRFEPFRSRKKPYFSEAFRRPVWSKGMEPYEALWGELESGALKYRHLDAAQLVKHAFGLDAQTAREGSLRPVLAYVFVETITENPVRITPQAVEKHRCEIADFAKRIEGARVAFYAFSYGEFLESMNKDSAQHAEHLRVKFNL